MKTGYSNFIAEYVEASSVGGLDCIDFQIVCPCCYEPVHKSGRGLGDQAIHFLSHYTKEKAFVAYCENRVASLSREATEKVNTVSREQKLAYFLEVVPDAAERLDDGLYLQEARRVASSKAVSVDFADKIRSRYRPYVDDVGELRLLVDTCLENLEKIKPEEGRLSPLAGRLRSASVVDVLRTMLAHNAKPAWSRLICLGVAMERMSAERAMHGEGMLAAGSGAKFRLLDALVSLNRTEAGRLMTEWEGQPGVGSNALMLMGDVVMNTLVLQLLRIDYFELLSRRVIARRAG